MRIRKQEFGNEEVELDGNSFEECTFRGSKLLFRGKRGVSLVDCIFERVEWVFLDEAQLTASFLRALSESTGDYGRALLVNSFPALREWLKQEILAKLPPDVTKNG